MDARQLAVRRAGETAALWALLVVCLVAAAVLPTRLVSLAKPPEVVNGIVVELDVTTDRHGSHAWFRMADGGQVNWTCGSKACQPSVLALQRIRWDTPMPAEFQFVGTRIVGLTIREAEVIEPDVEVGQASAGALGWSALSGLTALAAGAMLYHRRRSAYRRPKPRDLSLRKRKTP